MKRSFLLTLLAPVLAAGSLNAAVFLELDGIKGESKDDVHAESIEIESFSWGASNAATSGGGGGTGKATFSDIRFTTKLSKATPQLLLSCASSNPIPRATLFLRRSDEERTDYYTILLEGVLVSSLNQNIPVPCSASSTNPPPPSSGSSIPTDSFSLNFDKMTITYTGLDGSVTTGTAQSTTTR